MNLDNVIATRTNKKIYRDGDAAIKVFDAEFSKADILNEALNQARVEETGLNIPKVRSVTVVDGKWAIASDYISGKTLDQLMEEDPARYYEYLERFVDIQIEVLGTKPPMNLNKLKDKMHNKIELADIDEATKYELHTRLEGMPNHSKMCHGDFNPSNVIINDEGKAYIIDWSHVTQGNAGADAARTYLLFWLSGDIGGADDYLEMFCRKTGISKKYVQRWLPIVAASQSVKGKAEEREFLLSWVDVMEFPG